MDTCAACGARVEGGPKRCSRCGARLSRPGASLQVLGWVIATVSLIPLAVAAVAAERGNLLPLAVGIAMVVAGVSSIVAGRIATGSS